MLDKTTLRLIAEARLEDARALFEKARYDGAAYICGYAVEFALKARICETLDTATYPDDLPSFKTHKLDILLRLSGRANFILQNPAHAASWSIVKAKWQPEMRYQATGTVSSSDAQDLIDATSTLLQLL